MALTLLLAAVMVFSVSATTVVQQNAIGKDVGVRDLPHGRMWQDISTTTAGTLKSVSVFLGVSGPTCTPQSATFLLFSGKPSSLDDVAFFASNTAEVVFPLIARQEVTLTCDNVVCSTYDCLAWQNLTLATPLDVTAASALSFALANLGNNGARARIGVVSGTRGKSSLLVSPLFTTRFAEYAYSAVIESTSNDAPILAQSSADSFLSGTTVGLVVAGVVIAIALVALIVAVVVVRRRNAGGVSAKDDVRLGSPHAAWEYLRRRAVASKDPELVLVAEKDLDLGDATTTETDVDMLPPPSPARRSTLRFEDDDAPATPTGRSRVRPGSAQREMSPVTAWSYSAPASVVRPARRVDVSSAEYLDGVAGTSTDDVTFALDSAPATPSKTPSRQATRRVITVASSNNFDESEHSWAWNESSSSLRSPPAKLVRQISRAMQSRLIAESSVDGVQGDVNPDDVISHPFVVQGNEC